MKSMRTFLLLLLTLVSAAFVTVSAQENSQAAGTASSDLSPGVPAIIKMHQSGVPSDMIIKAVQSSGGPRTLTPNDLIALKGANVPDEVIRGITGQPEPTSKSLPNHASPGRPVAQPAIEKGRTKLLSVVALSYRAIPHERTSHYTTPGRSQTTCHGMGSDWGYWTNLSMDCETVTTPPRDQSVTTRSLEVYNLVEADGLLYTLRCTANWIGSNCSWLIPGDSFPAEIKDKIMWIKAAKGGNMGKEVKIKFQIQDIRPRQ